jgi:S1-C subfamily serine protease
MPAHGERVFNVGAPFGIWAPGMVPLLEGFYSGTDGRGNEFFTIPTRPGSSGSPIFNSEGELISLIHSASIMFESIGLGCKLDNLREIIKGHTYPSIDVPNDHSN